MAFYRPHFVRPLWDFVLRVWIACLMSTCGGLNWLCSGPHSVSEMENPAFAREPVSAFLIPLGIAVLLLVGGFWGRLLNGLVYLGVGGWFLYLAYERTRVGGAMMAVIAFAIAVFLLVPVVRLFTDKMTYTGLDG